MAHNALIRPGGVWNTLSAVTKLEWETFDLRQFQSINGDLGGTWAPSSQIIIGGSGLRVTGPARLDDVTAMTVSGSATIGLAARSVTRIVASNGSPAGSSTWLQQPSQGGCWKQDAATTEPLWFPFDVPNTAVITAFSVRADHQGAHSGDYPAATPPKVELVSVSKAGGVETIHSTVTDNPAEALFEQPHNVGASGLSITVDRTAHRYGIRVIGESGGFYQDGYTVICAEVTATVNAYDDFA